MLEMLAGHDSVAVDAKGKGEATGIADEEI